MLGTLHHTRVPRLLTAVGIFVLVLCVSCNRDGGDVRAQSSASATASAAPPVASAAPIEFSSELLVSHSAMVGFYPPAANVDGKQAAQEESVATSRPAAAAPIAESSPTPEGEASTQSEESADEESAEDSDSKTAEKDKKKKNDRRGIPVVNELVHNKCAVCHEPGEEGKLSRISYMRKSPEGWELSLKRMVRLNQLEVTPEEARQIVRYLSNDHGLARAEAEASMHEVERRVHWSDAQYEKELRESCGECHTLGRVQTQRRDAEEWKLLKATHLAFFPLAQWQAFNGSRRNGASIDWESLSEDEAEERWEAMQNSRGPDQADRVLKELTKTQPLFTPEWEAWQVNRREVPVAGTWSIIGHEISRGDVRGEVTITRVAEDEYETSWKLRYQDGRIVTRTGKGLLYAGYSWRGRSLTTAPKEPETLREVLVLGEDWNEMHGRIFTGEYHELGMDVRLMRRLDTLQMISVDDPALMIPSSEHWVTVQGSRFPEDLEVSDFNLGLGVSITAVEREDEGHLRLQIEVSRDAEQGERFLSFRSMRGALAFVLHDTIDYIKISPNEGYARIGGSFRPRQMERFEAIGMNRGRDGKPYTDDDFMVRVVPAHWELEEFPVREGDDDVQFVGTIDADTGVFTPGVDGPNPNRRWNANNIGDVYVTATCTLTVRKIQEPDPAAEEQEEVELLPIVMEEREFRARGHLLVMVPIYVNWDKYEWDRR